MLTKPKEAFAFGLLATLLRFVTYALEFRFGVRVGTGSDAEGFRIGFRSRLRHVETQNH